MGRPPLTFSVRLSTEDDVGAYLDLREAVASEGTGIGAEAPIDRERDSATFLDSITSPTAASWVAIDGDGALVGNLGIWLAGYGVAEIGMMVADGWRGRGVGSALLQTSIDWARGAGAHKVALQHWPTNDAAVALYEKFGFVEEGRLHRHYSRRDGSLWDAVVRGLVLDNTSPGGP